MQNHAPTIYAYATLEALLHAEKNGGAEANGGAKSVLPPRPEQPVTERPSEGNK